MTESDLSANLDRALARVHGCAPRNPATAQLAFQVADRIPLSHGASAENFARIAKTGTILSQVALAKRTGNVVESTTETELGTANSVFFFASPFRYPSSECGFLFRRDLEHQRHHDGNASPFDSGGLLNHFTRDDLAETPSSFLARHMLPIPAHRTLLSTSLERLFDTPEDYLGGSGKPKANPFGLRADDNDPRGWTHEVRIPHRVVVKGANHRLEAVFFVRGRHTDPRIKSYLSWCQTEKVPYYSIDTPRHGAFDALRRRCIAYVHEVVNREEG